MGHCAHISPPRSHDFTGLTWTRNQYEFSLNGLARVTYPPRTEQRLAGRTGPRVYVKLILITHSNGNILAVMVANNLVARRDQLWTACHHLRSNKLRQAGLCLRRNHLWLAGFCLSCDRFRLAGLVL